MKRLLSILMMLVMLTPGGVCASALCHHDADALRCHNGGKHTDGMKMLQDCSKIDLQAAAAASVEKPLVYKAPLMPVADVMTPSVGYLYGYAHARGPPPLSPDIIYSRPAHLLITLRFRP